MNDRNFDAAASDIIADERRKLEDPPDDFVTFPPLVKRATVQSAEVIYIGQTELLDRFQIIPDHPAR